MTTLEPTSPDLSDGGQDQEPVGGGSEWSAISFGVTLGVAGTIPVAVTVCCIICYACHRRRYATQVTWLHH